MPGMFWHEHRFRLAEQDIDEMTGTGFDDRKFVNRDLDGLLPAFLGIGRSVVDVEADRRIHLPGVAAEADRCALEVDLEPGRPRSGGREAREELPKGAVGELQVDEDRKSTRLNSSHPSISYAVFCLKKKK